MADTGAAREVHGLTHQQILAIKQIAATLVVVGCCRHTSIAQTPPLELRLVPIGQALQQVTKLAKLDRVEATRVYQTAHRFGLRLDASDKHLIAAKSGDGRFFSAFYTTLQNATDVRPYVVQRIKLTKSSFDHSGKRISNSTTYLVEAFRTEDGKTRSLDQHFAGYSLHGATRRVVVKEFEIGIGSVPKICDQGAWPFKSGAIYKELQGYGTDAAMFDAVRFDQSVQYKVIADFCADGSYQFLSPELGFHLPSKSPAKQVVHRGELRSDKRSPTAPTDKASGLLSRQSLLQVTDGLR